MSMFASSTASKEVEQQCVNVLDRKSKTGPSCLSHYDPIHYFSIPLAPRDKRAAISEPGQHARSSMNSLSADIRDFLTVYDDHLMVGFSKRKLLKISGACSELDQSEIEWKCHDGVVSDGVARSLAREIRNEINSGALAAQDCVRAFTALLAVHIVRTYSNIGRPDTRAGHRCLGPSPRWLVSIDAYIREHIAEHLSLERLADFSGLSTSHFSRVFLQQFGMSPHRYVMNLRLDRARLLSAYTTISFESIALMVGFSTNSHMTATMRRDLGLTPSEVRRGVALTRMPQSLHNKTKWGRQGRNSISPSVAPLLW